MKAKIYQIEYQSKVLNTEYSTNFDEAMNRLQKRGYFQQTKLSDSNNEEYWERQQGSFFGCLKAKIVEIECINDIPDFEYRIAAAMEVVKKMTFAEIYDMACPAGDPIPGVLIQEDYQRQSTRFIFKDYFVDVHNDVVIKIERW